MVSLIPLSCGAYLADILFFHRTLYFLGVITCPGLVTISLTVLWDRQTKAAAIISPIVGLASGIATWIATSWYYGDGIIDVTTTGNLLSCMWGNIVSFAVPAILSPAISLAFPGERFSWNDSTPSSLLVMIMTAIVSRKKKQEKLILLHHLNWSI